MTDSLGAIQGIDARKRRVYLILLGLGALGALLAVAVNAARPEPSSVNAVASLASLAVMASLAVLARRHGFPLVVLEWTLLIAFTALVVANLLFGLYLMPHDTGALEGARAVLHWVPVLFLVAFIAFDAPLARWAAFGVFAAVALVSLPSALVGTDGGALGPGSAEALAQVFLAYGVTLAALAFFAGQQQRLAAWRATAQEMRHLALTDALTGLANRRWAEEQLELEMDRADRYGHGFSVVMVDIDWFKALNDAHGHPAGDDVLVDLGRSLRAMVRSTDQVARWGGEEFLILAPETPIPAAVELAEALRSRVAAEVLGSGHAVTISLGVAGFRNGDSRSMLIDRADVALYRAKRGGRNRVAIEAEVGAVTARELQTIA